MKKYHKSNKEIFTFNDPALEIYILTLGNKAKIKHLISSLTIPFIKMQTGGVYRRMKCIIRFSFFFCSPLKTRKTENRKTGTECLLKNIALILELIILALECPKQNKCKMFCSLQDVPFCKERRHNSGTFLIY